MKLKSRFAAAVIVTAFAAASVFGADGDPYTWTRYDPNISYDFREQNKNFQMPTRDLTGFPRESGRKSSGWWTFVWGPNRKSDVTDAAIDNMLERMNEEFAYFRDSMGWQPDKMAQNGYRSTICLYGSNLYNDASNGSAAADSNALGGWQSSTRLQNQNWPIVLLSYYPVSCFDPASKHNDKTFQTGGVVHEGIHAILASINDGNSFRSAAWFHEGGNTWLQQQADAQRTGRFGSWADLNGPAMAAPFMPIECYSGWLQDGSFGGPAAEGVNMYEGGKQICTWRKWLGGHQYGNTFPTFLGEWLGAGAIPWLWQNGTGGKRVLETMAEGLGERQTRRLISEYRAKQATLDFGRWTESAKNSLYGTRFGQNYGPEWEPYWINSANWKATPYAKTTNNGGVLTPDSITLPGWTGANQIALTIPANMNMLAVDFMPDTANMTLQLCYRDIDGYAVYSEIVEGTAGQTKTCYLRLDKRPAQNVVMAVITSTDYLYRNDNTRKAKYKYKIGIKDGVTTANVDTKWYNLNNLKVTNGYGNQGSITKTVSGQNRNSPIAVSTLKVSAGRRGVLNVNLSIPSPANVSLDIYNIAGARVKSIPIGSRAAGRHTETIDTHGLNLSSGSYIVTLRGVPGAASPAMAVMVR
jgi:hypothetical protein